MAPPRMFWRYLTLTLLLGIPSSHILTSATYNSPTDEAGSQADTRDQLIEQIVQELTREQREEARAKISGSDNQFGGQQLLQTEQVLDGLVANGKGGISKKDETKPSSANRGLNLEASEPAAQARSPGDGTGKDENEDQVETGTIAVHKVTYAAPGKYEAHRKDNHDDEEEKSRALSHNDTRFAVVVGAGLAAGFVGLMMAGICYYKFRKNAKAATDIEYPAYGVTGPMKEKIPSPGDRKLAQSAQMYHYQHQKQQMIAMEKANGDMKHDASDDDSEEDNVEGDYTVYECPGLAPTGEMEVINPLFRGGEESTAASTETPSAPPDPSQGNQ